MGILDISLERANDFYAWGWRFSILGAVITALGVGLLMWGTRVRDHDFEFRMTKANSDAAAAIERAADANRRAAEANLQLARADANLLAEQRLTARERMRLERLERAVLPRSLSPQQFNALASKLRGLGPINIAIAERQEPMNFGFQLVQLFQGAGIMGRLITLSEDSQQTGVVMYTANEHGREAAEILWRNAGIAGGVLGGARPIGLESIPKDQNTLIVGDNDAAFQPIPGQPGEDLDEHGRPVPEPR